MLYDHDLCDPAAGPGILKRIGFSFPVFGRSVSFPSNAQKPYAEPPQLIFEDGNLLLKNSYLMSVLSFYLFDPLKRLLLSCSGALPRKLLAKPTYRQ